VEMLFSSAHKIYVRIVSSLHHQWLGLCWRMLAGWLARWLAGRLAGWLAGWLAAAAVSLELLPEEVGGVEVG
jgi:hypothetical protein